MEIVKMKKIIRLLKENKKIEEKKTKTLEPQGLSTIHNKVDMPSIYVETLTKENQELQIKNRELKQQLTHSNKKLKDKEDEIIKLQAIINRYRKMAKSFDINSILHRNALGNRSIEGVSDTLSDIEALSPSKIGYLGKTKEKLAAFLLLVEAMKKLDLPKIISLCIK
jgi:chromosome segregation ATPase